LELLELQVELSKLQVQVSAVKLQQGLSWEVG
jgi:hypothetical protein